MSTEKKNATISAINPDAATDGKKTGKRKAPGAGRVASISTAAYAKRTMLDFLTSRTGLAAAALVVQSANLPVKGSLSDGEFMVSHTGRVEITTMNGTPLARSFSGAVEYVKEHAADIVAIIDPAIGGTKVHTIVKRASEKDVLAALLAASAGDDIPDMETVEEEESGSELPEADDDSGDESESDSK